MRVKSAGYKLERSISPSDIIRAAIYFRYGQFKIEDFSKAVKRTSREICRLRKLVSSNGDGITDSPLDRLLSSMEENSLIHLASDFKSYYKNEKTIDLVRGDLEKEYGSKVLKKLKPVCENIWDNYNRAVENVRIN